MRIVPFPDDDVPTGLRRQIAALEAQAWPGEPASGHDPALRPVALLLLDEDGRVVASLVVLSKSITHAGERYDVSGLSSVVTDAASRGRGHGGRLITGARAWIAEHGADLGLFTCDPPLTDFYRRAGWRGLPGTVLVGGTVDDPFPSDRFDKVTLADFVTTRARAHAADFEHTRIALYPGTIDKLW